MWSQLSRTSFRSIGTSSALRKSRTVFYNKYRPVKGPDRQDFDYFEKQAAALPLNDLYIDNLKMLWEEKFGTERELMMKAGDRLIGRAQGDYGLSKIAPLRPKVEYEDVSELKDATEEVRKIFSVEFGERRDYTNACKQDLINLVKTHKYDKDSLQIKIAWTTVIIRHLTALIDELATRSNRRPTQFTFKVTTMVNYRRKLLRQLREQNYDEFAKILDTLKISYQVEKQPEHVKTRKAWSLFILQKRVEVEKEQIMEKLRAEFEENKDQKVSELQNKIEDLVKEQKQIHEQLKKFEAIENRVPSNVTGKYQPKLVEELIEYSQNSLLFNHPKSKKSIA